MFPHIPLFASANLSALKKPGSDQIGPDRIGSDRIGSDRIDRIGSDRSDRIGSNRSDRIDQTGSIRPDRKKIDRTRLDRIGTRIGSPIRPQIGLQGFN